jgi:phosphoglycolate phosphatase (TIGR01487 family)
VLKALLTDVDGTITDAHRRIHTGAIGVIRDLMEQGIEVVLASGNTACFMDALGRMIGTSGSFIGENGGVHRAIYTGELRINGDPAAPRAAFEVLNAYFARKGVRLELYSPQYRFVDIAFARTVSSAEVHDVVRDFPVTVLDTGFAIHLQPSGITKATGFQRLAADMGLRTSDFLAIGDAMNDREMLAEAGIGVTVANAPADLRAQVAWVSEKRYGDGFIDAVRHYSSYFLD